MRVPDRAIRDRQGSFWRAWMESLDYIRHSRSIWSVLGLVALFPRHVGAAALCSCPVLAGRCSAWRSQDVRVLNGRLRGLGPCRQDFCWRDRKGFNVWIYWRQEPPVRWEPFLVFFSYARGIGSSVFLMATGGAAFLVVMTATNTFLQMNVPARQAQPGPGFLCGRHEGNHASGRTSGRLSQRMDRPGTDAAMERSSLSGGSPPVRKRVEIVMLRALQAMQQLAIALETRGIPYMIFGGQAAKRYGLSAPLLTWDLRDRLGAL